MSVQTISADLAVKAFDELSSSLARTSARAHALMASFTPRKTHTLELEASALRHAVALAG